MPSASEVWPNLYIVGAAKAGTSSLYEILRTHPQVFFPWMKEPNYFLTVAPPADKIGGIAPHCFNDPQKYQDLYREARGTPVLGDASVTYLWDQNAPRKIFEIRPDARIIIIMRDPIARAYSHYFMLRKLGLESESTFLDALQKSQARDKSDVWIGSLYIEFGLYYEQVRRYIETFGKDQVLLLLTEELNQRPAETMERVTRHLGIDPISPQGQKQDAVFNAYAMPRFPGIYRFASQRLFSPELRRKYLPSSVREWLRASPLLYDNQKPRMDDESRLFLQKIYEPDVGKLEGLLGRDLSVLRKSWQ